MLQKAVKVDDRDKVANPRQTSGFATATHSNSNRNLAAQPEKAREMVSARYASVPHNPQSTKVANENERS